MSRRQNIPSFLTLLGASVVLLLPATLRGAGFIGGPLQVMPQVVAGVGFQTGVEVQNTSDADCAVILSVAPFAQQLTVPVTINQQPFTLADEIPGLATRRYDIQYNSTGQPAQVGLVLETTTPECQGHLSTTTRYVVEVQDKLKEIFSYGSVPPLLPGVCATTPIHQGNDGNTQRSAGLAVQAPGFIQDGQLGLHLLDETGNELGDPVLVDFNGDHLVGLLDNFFDPILVQGSGQLKVCNETPREQPSYPIYSLFIDVTSRAGEFQLGALPVRVEGNVCQPDMRTLCLNSGRFQVQAEFVNQSSPSDTQARSAGKQEDDSGQFYFFNPDNWELLVKILNACGSDNHFWVFAAATTNVEYTLTVTDTQTNTVKHFNPPQGNPAAAITDTSAFATCP